MAWYKCNKCGYEYHSGFFSPKWCKCPKCWSKFSQVFGVIKTVLKLAVPAAILMAILGKVYPPGYANIFSYAAAALDSTTLYAYSKDAYLESIIHGRQTSRYFVIAKAVPYYSSIVSKAALDSAEPLGELAPGVVVELGSVIRKGEDVWIPVSFYLQEKPQQAFALFPRDWEENATVYDWNERVSGIAAAYTSTVKNNFQLMEVAPEDEKAYREKYNDYYKVKDIGSNTFFYAPKTDKSKIDAIHSYYLNRESINMVILQADTEWERPALEIIKTEDSQ
jgi:hypothetical protein